MQAPLEAAAASGSMAVDPPTLAFVEQEPHQGTGNMGLHALLPSTGTESVEESRENPQ